MATLNLERRKRYFKRNLIIWLVCLIIEIVVSPILIYGMHRVFSNTTGQISMDTFSYTQVIKMLITDQQARTLWLLVEILYIAFSSLFLLDNKPAISKVETVKITEDIEIPVPAGNGQHGKERFMTEKEKGQLYSVFEYTGKEELKGKGGVVVQMTKKGSVEHIFYVKDDIHSLIIGATRSGKTRRILIETMFMQLLSGVSVICSDVKGELFYYTSPYARQQGYEVLALDLRSPEKSIHYNFLQPILDALEREDRAKAIDYTWDLVSVLVGQQKGEPIWYNGETATIAASILIIALDAPEQYRNLANVYYFLAFMCESDIYGNMPLNDYLKQLPDTHPAKGVFAMATIAPSKTRSSFFTSALGTLRLFTNPLVAEMTSKSDFKLEDISKKKSILYMIIPDEKKTLYPLVSILVTQLYTAQVELANKSGLRLPIDTDYDLDEIGNFPNIPGLGNMLSAGASRGVRVNMVIQDYQQLESKYKDDFKNIRTNCMLKIYLKSDDTETLKNVSENLGKYTVEVSSASTNMQSKGINNVSHSSSASLTGRSLLEPAEIRRIQAPYTICMMTGQYAALNKLPDLSEYYMNEILGLGDEKHNRKLIMEREQERKARSAESIIPLWGIWKKYQQTKREEGEGSERVSFLNYNT